MPIDVLTGQPGNGKTALMMERLMAATTKGDRPIVAAGIDGLAPGLALQLDDPRKWNAIDPDAPAVCDCTAGKGERHGHVIPDGSLIFVDEAWKWFGHLQDASRQATPAHVLELAEHRHRGLDFVWTTQMPNQLFPFVRGLIGTHTHVIRRYGTSFIDTFTWGELNEDVKSQTKRDIATRETRTLPAAVFDQYKSATLHTIKRRVPWKVIALPVVVVAAIGTIWFAYHALKPENLVGTVPIAGQAAEVGQPADPDAFMRGEASGGAVPVAMDATEYARLHTPLIPGRPWTAPAYLERKVTTDPIIVCAASGAGVDAQGARKGRSCTCLTEQGTALDEPLATCEGIARKGPAYNPFKERVRESRGTPGQSRGREVVRSDAGPATESALSGGGAAFGEVAAYGGIGVGNSPP